jgi:membrane protein DedA with SNARE-associated domain
MVEQAFTNLLFEALSHPIILPAIIFVGALLLEDITTILLGVLSADGDIHFWTALFWLYALVIIGDFFLYYLGRLAADHPKLARFVNHEKVEPFKAWLEQRLLFAIFSTRFLPGLRTPVSTSSGFFKMPFKPFAAGVVLATTIWTPILFSLAYLYGDLTAELLGKWRWPVGFVFAALLFLWGRHNLNRRIFAKNEQK